MRQVLPVVLLIVLLIGGWSGTVRAEESWRDGFDRICAKTGEAGTMSLAELSQAISETERLRERIADSNDPDRKVYLFRIDKCRAFFVFMRDTAAADNPQ